MSVQLASFENNILPTIERFARKVFRADADAVGTAIVLGWYYWSTGPQDLPASVWATAAARAVRCGRDLPGLNDSRRKDALDVAWQGAGMGEVAARDAGPLHVIIAKEAYELLLADLTDRQRMMVDAIAGGMVRTDRLAETLGVTAGRVSQMRREIMAKLEE
ncbi:MAG TPA: hypothetical protein PKE20_09805 [Promineifilum sp.]|nr:hypothetical protein [Promineifilum sp.]